jgi:phosphoglycolate phosphatase
MAGPRTFSSLESVHVGPMMPYDFVTFCLDGTLVDSRSSIVPALQHVLREHGVRAPEPPELRQYLGPPLIESLRTLVGTDEARIQGALKMFQPMQGELGG